MRSSIATTLYLARDSDDINEFVKEFKEQTASRKLTLAKKIESDSEGDLEDDGQQEQRVSEIITRRKNNFIVDTEGESIEEIQQHIFVSEGTKYDGTALGMAKVITGSEVYQPEIWQSTFPVD